MTGYSGWNLLLTVVIVSGVVAVMLHILHRQYGQLGREVSRRTVAKEVEHETKLSHLQRRVNEMEREFRELTVRVKQLESGFRALVQKMERGP